MIHDQDSGSHLSVVSKTSVKSSGSHRRVFKVMLCCVLIWQSLNYEKYSLKTIWSVLESVRRQSQRMQSWLGFTWVYTTPFSFLTLDSIKLWFFLNWIVKWYRCNKKAKYSAVRIRGPLTARSSARFPVFYHWTDFDMWFRTVNLCLKEVIIGSIPRPRWLMGCMMILYFELIPI